MTTTAPSGQPATPAEAVDLDAIEDRANAATPPPWGVANDTRIVRGLQITGRGSYTCIQSVAEVDDDDRCDWGSDEATEVDVPALVAEVRRLRTELADLKWAEILTEQGCAEGRHTEWYADTQNLHACPWCEVERLREELDAAPATPCCTQRDGYECEVHSAPRVGEPEIVQMEDLPDEVQERAVHRAVMGDHDGMMAALREGVDQVRSARATDPGPAAPTVPLSVAQQLRDAMVGQHEAASHVLEVHALGTEECEACQQAADECSGDKACDRWKAWQAQYEAAMVLPLSTVPPAGTEADQ